MKYIDLEAVNYIISELYHIDCKHLIIPNYQVRIASFHTLNYLVFIGSVFLFC